MADPIRLIIAGSRGCNPTDEMITAEVIRLPLDWGTDVDGERIALIPEKIGEVVCGTAKGADIAGQRWAIALGIPVHYEPITDQDVRRWGKWAAPKMRNRRMAERGDMAICWWDGLSSGTPDMAIRMVIRGKHVQAVPCKRERRARGPIRVGAGGGGKSEPPPPAVDDSRAPAA